MLTPDLQQLTDVRPQLEQSLMAQAWTVAGDVLWSIERRNFDDLASSWRRLCRLRGVDFSAEPLPDTNEAYDIWWNDPGDQWDGVAEAISAALRNAEALDGVTHWHAAAKAVQTALVAQAAERGNWARYLLSLDDFRDADQTARTAAHYARLALGGGQ